MSQSSYMRRAGVAQALARLIQMVGGIVLLPAMVGSLGVEKYGEYVVLTAILQWLIMDGGLTQGLKHEVLQVQDIYKQGYVIQSLVSNALVLLILFGVAISAGAIVVRDWIVDVAVMGTRVGIADDMTLIAVLCAPILVLPLITVKELYTATGRDVDYYLWSTGGVVVGTVAQYYYAKHGGAYVTPYIMLTQLPLIVANMAAWLWFALRVSSHAVPSFRALSFAEMWRLVRISRPFFAHGVSWTAANSLDTVFIASTVGPAAAGTYSICGRLMGYVGTGVSFVTYPMWAGLRRALLAGQTAWAVAISKRVITLLTLVTGVSYLGYVLVGQYVLDFWTSGAVEVTRGALAIIGLVSVLRIAGDAFSSILKGLGDVVSPAVSYSGQVVLQIALCPALGLLFGYSALLLGLVVSGLLTHGWWLPLRYYNRIKALENQTP